MALLNGAKNIMLPEPDFPSGEQLTQLIQRLANRQNLLSKSKHGD